MSDMPERIWAWREERYGTTWAITPGDKKAVEYRRANLHSLPDGLVETIRMCEARATRMMRGESAGIGPIVSVLRDILKAVERKP